MACSNCGLLDICRNVIGSTEYDKPPCAVEAQNSTSDNKDMFQLLCDIVDKYVPDGVFRDGDDELFERYMTTVAQQKYVT